MDAAKALRSVPDKVCILFDTNVNCRERDQVVFEASEFEGA